MILTVILALGFPFLALRLERYSWVPSFFSAVVLCYAFGIILGNAIPSMIDESMAEQLAGAGMIIALPMLLFGAQLKENWRLAGPGLIAYGLCALAGLISTALAAYYFQDSQEDGWKVAGMLTGLYTGGTPNMQAIGIAVDAPADYVVLLQAADIVGGGVFLLMLMTIIHPFLGTFLPAFRIPEQEKIEDTTTEIKSGGWWILPTLLSIGVGGLAAGGTYLFTGDIGGNTTLLILLLTTFSLLLSFSPKVNQMPGAYRQGEYFLLIFCVALGLMANFEKLLADGLPLLAFSLVALIGTILIHWLLARIFKLDRDTVMVSATAALYGPVFIAQITTAIDNKRLLAPGIALSLLGLAVGNYLGIGVAYLAKWLMSVG
jgi:uncharacterized membrane protein